MRVHTRACACARARACAHACLPARLHTRVPGARRLLRGAAVPGQHAQPRAGQSPHSPPRRYRGCCQGRSGCRAAPPPAREWGAAWEDRDGAWGCHCLRGRGAAGWRREGRCQPDPCFCCFSWGGLTRLQPHLLGSALSGTHEWPWPEAWDAPRLWDTCSQLRRDLLVLAELGGSRRAGGFPPCCCYRAAPRGWGGFGPVG